jgi:TolB protein
LAPAWSPDSTRIVFTSDGADETGEIYVMNADGSGLTRLTDDPAYDAFPAWRP